MTVDASWVPYSVQTAQAELPVLPAALCSPRQVLQNKLASGPWHAARLTLWCAVGLSPSLWDHVAHAATLSDRLSDRLPAQEG